MFLNRAMCNVTTRHRNGGAQPGSACWSHFGVAAVEMAATRAAGLTGIMAERSQDQQTINLETSDGGQPSEAPDELQVSVPDLFYPTTDRLSSGLFWF